MKNLVYTFFASALITLASFSVMSQESGRKALSFRLENTPTGNTKEAAAFPKKSQRLSSKGGQIKIFADNDVPDSITTAFQLAADSWSAKIKNKIPI